MDITPAYFREEVCRFREAFGLRENYTLEGIQSLQRGAAALLLVANKAGQNASKAEQEQITITLDSTISEFIRRVELVMSPEKHLDSK